MKLQRNEKCPCGSGKKYKKCCYLDPDKNAEIIRAVSRANTPGEIVQLLSKPMEVYQLKVVLIRMGHQEIGDEVSRTFEVEGNSTLYDLHMDIQHAFDWDNDHMFSFYLGDKLFDEVKVQKIRDKINVNGKLPTIVSKVGTPPPQYGDFE